MRRGLATGFLFLWLGSFVPTPSPSPQGVIAISGLVGGRTLVPLGQYVAGRWVRTWPEPEEQVERKLSTLKDLPRDWYPVAGGVPSEWYLWSEELRGVPIRVGTPTLAEAHCQAVWGLSTRLQAFGHETTAIATNIHAGVQPFQQWTLGAGADTRLRAFLRTEFDKSATAEIRSKRKDADAVLAQQPDCDPIVQLACIKTGKDDDELCSFEASRRLGTRPTEMDRECEEVVVVQGWFMQSNESVTLLTANTTLTDCDFKSLRNSTPLLLITVAPRAFVIVREHGYEDESFVVFEFLGNRLKRVLEIAGGGC